MTELHECRPARWASRVTALTALLGLVAVLAGCSATAEDAGGAQEPDEVTAAWGEAIDSLDPHGAHALQPGTRLAAQALYSRLVRPKTDGSLAGELAVSWDSNDEATFWTFTLWEDATFSNGERVTANHIVASFERMQRLDGPLAQDFLGYSMSASYDNEVRVATPAPDSALPSKLSRFYVLPAGAGAEDGDFFHDPVGSGPFTVGRFIREARLELERRDPYWGQTPPSESVTVVTMPDLAERMTGLRTGEVDVVWDIPDDQAATLRERRALTVESATSDAVLTIWFNAGRPGLRDAAVRRALGQAVDFESIVNRHYPETGMLAEGPVSPLVTGYAPQRPVAHDPHASRAALRDADFDFSRPLRLHFTGAWQQPFVDGVVADLGEIGVRVEPRQQRPPAFAADLEAMDWDIAVQELATPTFDAAGNLGLLYSCEAGRTGYCNPELDELLDRAIATTSPLERAELYDQASQIIRRDAVGVFPMALRIVYAWRDEVLGVAPDPSGLPDFAGVRIAQR